MSIKLKMDSLFAVDYLYLYTKLLVYVFAEMLCAVDTAVLSSCAAEADHEVGKSALFVACDRGVDKSIAVVKENAISPSSSRN